MVLGSRDTRLAGCSPRAAALPGLWWLSGVWNELPDVVDRAGVVRRRGSARPALLTANVILEIVPESPWGVVVCGGLAGVVRGELSSRPRPYRPWMPSVPGATLRVELTSHSVVRPWLSRENDLIAPGCPLYPARPCEWS